MKGFACACKNESDDAFKQRTRDRRDPGTEPDRYLYINCI